MQVHTVMAMKALTTAFLMWQEEQMRLHEAGEQTSWDMYRRKLKALKRNKLIVFVGLFFGIFPSHEVLFLEGVPVRDAERDLKQTREQIYIQYTGTQPPDSS